MKTCVEISDPLFKEAKDLAREEGITLRALIERGLQLALAERHDTEQAAPMLDLRVGGNGLQPEFRDAEWSRIRDAAYEGHGT